MGICGRPEATQRRPLRQPAKTPTSKYKLTPRRCGLRCWVKQQTLQISCLTGYQLSSFLENCVISCTSTKAHSKLHCRSAASHGLHSSISFFAKNWRALKATWLASIYGNLHRTRPCCPVVLVETASLTGRAVRPERVRHSVSMDRQPRWPGGSGRSF